MRIIPQQQYFVHKPTSLSTIREVRRDISPQKEQHQEFTLLVLLPQGIEIYVFSNVFTTV